MSCICGIYWGASNICLAVNKDGRSEVVANESGDRVIPAIVAFLNGEQTVGLPAKQGMFRNSKSTITNVKHVFGGCEVTIEKEMRENTCNIKMNDSVVQYVIEREKSPLLLKPIDVLSVIFKKMLESAKQHTHTDVCKVVLTIPWHFSSDHRNLIKEYATKAGFQVLHIITEPSAAVLAYHIGEKDNNSNWVLVYRVGGTSMDATLLRAAQGLCSVKSYVYKPCLGGNIFTNLLADFCAKEFYRQYKADLTESRKSMMKVRNAAEICKHTLSNLTSAHCFADSVFEGVDLNLNISRARFESLIANCLPDFLTVINEVLVKADIEASAVDHVILTGGTSKVPCVQQQLTTLFPSSKILSTQLPDEVMAIGAAEQAALLEQTDGINEKMSELSLDIDIITKGIYIRISKEQPLVPVLPEGSPIPNAKKLGFNLAPEQNSFQMDLIEGSSKTDNDNACIAKLVMTDLPTGGEVTCTFKINKECLEVHLLERTSGKESSFSIDVDQNS